VRYSSDYSNVQKMLPKILIANRGEIARRVIRSAKKMGIKTVAVYSDADSASLHVREADEAVCIGPAPSVESYLVIQKLVDACKLTGAKGVHPGYGFLSENKDFQSALEAEGIAFIGPGQKAIMGMGDKIESKKIAKDAGVNCIPGNPDEIKDEDTAVIVAAEIGYPVMVKASAGGGGKGMRVAWDDEGTREAYRLSKAEAASSFGDDRLLIEKFIEQPRHIEIQVMADSFGNTVYLAERECSIQRRNQKVVEEAPSPFLDEAVRKTMGEQACALAKAVDYQSAGTVEFIVDKDKNHYFLEMNTRLQVEHPITEMITGVDLVEQMIRVAAGEKLALTQADISITGWAIESRVYAEDPVKDFLPSVGLLTNYREPCSTPGVRCDSGVADGSEISMYYDPMISKLVTYAEDRPQAIERMKSALDEYVIEGVSHNISLLHDIMENEVYTSGNTSTDFIANQYPDGFSVNFTPEKEKELLAMTAVVQRAHQLRNASFEEGCGQFASFQKDLQAPFSLGVQLAKDQPVRQLNVVPLADGELMVSIDGEASVPVSSSWALEGPVVHGTVGGTNACVQAIARTPSGIKMVQHGTVYDIRVASARTAALWSHMPVPEEIDTSKYIIAPISGTIRSIAVQPGDEVAAGAEVAVLEAMKMHNVLRAETGGIVKSVNFTPGQNCDVDDFVVEFENNEA